MAKNLHDYAVEFARKGGKARAKKLTAAQRKEIARKGGLAKKGYRKAVRDGR
jgi:hypothetical protein